MKYLIILILILSSCTTQRKCNRLFPPERWESTQINTTHRQHILTLRSIETILSGVKPIYIDTAGKVTSERSRLETEFAISEAWIDNNQLHHWLNQKGVVKSDTVYLTDTVIQKEKGEIREVNRLFWWQKVLMGLGVVMLIILLYKFTAK